MIKITISSDAKGRKQMNIVVLDGYTENPGDLSWDALGELGELTVYDRTPAEDEDMIAQRIKNAEIVLTNKTPVTKTVIERCKDLKYIGVLATGYNVVDTQAAKDRRIIVTNIPTYGTDAVAQFTVGLLLEICHHIGHHSDAVKTGRWGKSLDWCFWDYPLIELAGKTAGVIGFGRIGRAAGSLFRALGMEVLAYDRYPCREGEAIAAYVSMEELLRRSDVISLHCPLFPETEGLICKETLSKTKPGVILLNTSRGGLVNERDLADALHSGHVYAAGVDVASREPAPADNPLLKEPNCIMTPHIAWAAKESRSRLMDIAVENVRKFLEGDPVNVVK